MIVDGKPCSLHPHLPVIGTCNRCGDFGCAECLPPGRTRCIRCAPTGSVAKPDVAVAFKWVFQDPDYISKVLVGSACMLFSVFLIPAFVLLGYHLEVARRERQAPQTRLPDWSGWSSYLVDGFKFYVAILLAMMAFELILGTVIGVVVLIFVLIGSAGGGGAAAVVGAFAGIALVFCIVPFILVITYAIPALQLEYLRTNSIFAGFHLGAIWRIVSERPGDYFMLFIGAFVTRFLANLVGQLMCLIGLFVTAPWAFYTEGWLVGRYWAWLDNEEGVGL